MHNKKFWMTSLAPHVIHNVSLDWMILMMKIRWSVLHYPHLRMRLSSLARARPHYPQCCDQLGWSVGWVVLQKSSQPTQVKALLKHKLNYERSVLPEFINKVKEVIAEQQQEVERAVIGRGKYQFREQYKHLENF